MTNDESDSHERIPSAVAAAVGTLLAEVDADVAARKPVCIASGRCCKFESYGHRLYVTGAELLYFAATQTITCEAGSGNDVGGIGAGGGRSVSLKQFFSTDPTGCPYQVDGLCTAREARPLGCRIYFCDENAKHWQNDVYEKYHARLQALHQQFGLPYRYVEWRAGLRELMDTGGKEKA